MKRDIFQALADPTRRAIIMLLATQSMTPNALAEHFDLTRQAVSKHIQMLAECDLLKHQKSGREIHYHLDSTKMDEIERWLEQLRNLLEKRFDQLDEVLNNLKK